MDIIAQIVETWQIHGRIMLYLLDTLTPEQLDAAPTAKARAVGDHLAHIHSVRQLWLKAAQPELLNGLTKLEKAADKTVLRAALEASGAATETLLRTSLEENGGRIKGFKPHAVAFLGYLIAHEQYHLGKMDLILRAAGLPVDDKTHYGLWEWGVR